MTHIGAARFGNAFDYFAQNQARAQGSGNDADIPEPQDTFTANGSAQNAGTEKKSTGIIGFFKKVFKIGAMVYGAYVAVKAICNRVFSLFTGRKEEPQQS